MSGTSEASNVVTLYSENMSDVKAMARRFAERINNGDYGEVRSVAVVVEHPDGDVSICGWGEADQLRSIGLLNLGAAVLSCGGGLD